jgi:hypothetical protein
MSWFVINPNQKETKTMSTTTCEFSTISSLDLDNVTGGVNWGEVGRRAVSWGATGATAGAVGGAVVGGVAGAGAGGVGAIPGAVAGAGIGSRVGRVAGAVAGAGTAIYDTWGQ